MALNILKEIYIVMDSITGMFGGASGPTALSSASGSELRFGDTGLNLGTLAKMAGSLSKAAAFSTEARAIKADAEAIIQSKAITATQFRQNAQLLKALGQHETLALGRAGEKLQSDLIAQGAASMGGVDVGVIQRAQDIAEETDFRKRTATATAEQRAGKQRFAADVKDFESELTRAQAKRAAAAKRSASRTSVLDIFSHGSLFKKYGEAETKTDPNALIWT